MSDDGVREVRPLQWMDDGPTLGMELNVDQKMDFTPKPFVEPPEAPVDPQSVTGSEAQEPVEATEPPPDPLTPAPQEPKDATVTPIKKQSPAPPASSSPTPPSGSAKNPG